MLSRAGARLAARHLVACLATRLGFALRARTRRSATRCSGPPPEGLIRRVWVLEPEGGQ